MIRKKEKGKITFEIINLCKKWNIYSLRAFFCQRLQKERARWLKPYNLFWMALRSLRSQLPVKGHTRPLYVCVKMSHPVHRKKLMILHTFKFTTLLMHDLLGMKAWKVLKIIRTTIFPPFFHSRLQNLKSQECLEKSQEPIVVSNFVIIAFNAWHFVLFLFI